jgi:hypothetical protein
MQNHPPRPLIKGTLSSDDESWFLLENQSTNFVQQHHVKWLLEDKIHEPRLAATFDRCEEAHDGDVISIGFSRTASDSSLSDELSLGDVTMMLCWRGHNVSSASELRKSLMASILLNFDDS